MGLGLSEGVRGLRDWGGGVVGGHLWEGGEWLGQYRMHAQRK